MRGRKKKKRKKWKEGRKEDEGRIKGRRRTRGRLADGEEQETVENVKEKDKKKRRRRRRMLETENCWHGANVKKQKFSGSRKKVDLSGAGTISPLAAAPDPEPKMSTRLRNASVSSDLPSFDYSNVFDKLTAVFKCEPLYDHIPKIWRENAFPIAGLTPYYSVSNRVTSLQPSDLTDCLGA
ncbi:hypothetical protein HELRODRAFT_179153 [Helobdella robusta]|uniref:Uncharacterized protein n=1 Tax=Helobdella robusta TaxID=6412 RepID=T1FE96_HELRO|nr:hypothetical protein HELRODRAFT_179153 [Helobdella robusta]ESN95682.1 hypothetical protein HELRODRAFT_179153 [Helobdella robusta]